MVPDPTLWERLRSTRMVQVLVVYLAGAWVLLQVLDLFSDAFAWPAWVLRASIVVLVLGLVVTVLGLWAHGRAHRVVDAAGVGHQGRSAIIGVVAVSLLLAGAALWVIARDRGRSILPGDAIAEAAPAIAILPFTVNDPELDRWREGMIDLLTTNLDGAGGIRAIDSRTVLARWREAVGTGGNADLPTALGVARNAGGRWGVVGSAVSAGASMRLVADVYDLDTGRSLGQSQVEGVPDSIFGLVDRLSIAVLGLVLPETGNSAAAVDLERITTSSVPALKAFLEGEALFRSGDFRAAVPVYERAVEADSTFALAHIRLGEAYGWDGGLGNPRVRQQLAAAKRHGARLPERSAEMLEVALDYAGFAPGATERAEALTARYPDDPAAWYLLGETRFHLRFQTVASPAEVREPFVRAIALDPRYVPARVHLLDLAFQRADSAEVARLIRDPAIATDYGLPYRLANALAYGDSAARATAAAVMDTAEFPTVGRTFGLLNHPRFASRIDPVGARVRERPDYPPQAEEDYAEALLHTGRLSALIALLAQHEAPDDPVREAVTEAWFVEAPLPPEVYRETFTPTPADTGAGERATVVALYALEQGDPAPARRVAAATAAAASAVEASGDSTTARFMRAVVDLVRGREAMLAGNDEAALATLDRAFRASGFAVVAGWIAQIHIDAGREAEAIRYLETFPPNPWIAEYLAPLYESVGRRDDAIETFAWIVEGWSDADPALQPRVARARSEIARLRGLQRG